MGLEQIVGITHRNHFRKLFERKTEYIRFDTKHRSSKGTKAAIESKIL